MQLDSLPLWTDLPEVVQVTLLRLLALALALFLILILRRVLTRILVAPLRRMTQRTGRANDDELVEAVLTPIRYIIIAVAILLSVRILATGDAISQFGTSLGRTFVIVGVILLFIKLVDIFMPSSNRLFSITGMTVPDRLLPFLRTTLKIFLGLMGFVIVVQEWGYDISGLIAGIGIGGLALSLAAQDTAKNLFGFGAIIADRPFDVGDYIVTPDVEGIVEEVGVRSTRVRRLDQALVTVPNSKLSDNAVLNWSKLKKRRVDYYLGVTYDATSDDIRVLLHRLREMLNNRATVEPDSVVVYFTEFGDNALNILVRCYLLLPDWGEFTAEKEQINLDVMDIVAGLNMSVAFPSRSIYVENMPALAESMVAVRNEITEDAPVPLTAQERALLEDPTSAMNQNPQQGSETDMPDEATDER